MNTEKIMITLKRFVLRYTFIVFEVVALVMLSVFIYYFYYSFYSPVYRQSTPSTTTITQPQNGALRIDLYEATTEARNQKQADGRAFQEKTFTSPLSTASLD